MTEISTPFNGEAMDEDIWSEMMRYVIPTGVVAVPWLDEVNELTVTTTGGANREISVDTGGAFVQGFYYKNDAAKLLNPGANSSPAGTRADLVVLECKWGVGAGVTAKIVPGTPGLAWGAGFGSLTGTPKPPDCVTSPGDTWQIPLAQVNVANGATILAPTDVLDRRAFINSGAAKSDTYIIAANNASPLIRANADAVIPLGSLNAQDIINYGIQQVSGLYGGGTVRLTEGRFDTINAINMLNSVNLRGQGWGSKIYYNVAGGYHPIIFLNGAQWCTIADLWMDGGGAAMGRGSLPRNPDINACGIYIYDASLDTVKNCYIQCCRNNGILVNTVGASSWGHRIEGNYIRNSYEAGIWTSGQAGIYTNNQLNFNGAGITLGGISDSVGAGGNIVSQNQINWNWRNGLEINAGPYLAYRNQISNNILQSNGLDSNNVYSAIWIYGAGATNNQIINNQIYTDPGYAAYKPMYGIYVDTTVSANRIAMNECILSAYSAANNIKCTRAGSSNDTPNWIRFNTSGCVAPNGSSYDA